MTDLYNFEIQADPNHGKGSKVTANGDPIHYCGGTGFGIPMPPADSKFMVEMQKDLPEGWDDDLPEYDPDACGVI